MSPVQSGSRSLLQQAATILALATLPARPSIEELMPPVESKPPVSTSLSQVEQPFRNIANEGDPSKGVINFLMQVHRLSSNTDPELISIGRYQGAILSELLRLDVSHVFKEGLTTEIKPEWIHEEVDIARAQELFLGIESAQWSDSQFRFLGTHGGDMVYAAIRPGVTLHSTTNSTFEAYINDGLSKELEPWEQDCLVMEAREVKCAAVANETMARLGAAPVAVIYGRNHTELPKRFLDLGSEARMEVADWPTLSVPYFQNVEVVESRDPSMQLELVRAADYIDAHNFPSLLTEEARWSALTKLNVRFEYFPDGLAELSEMLLASCETEGLAKQVRDLEKHGDGPFFAFSALDITSRLTYLSYGNAEELIKLAPKFESWGFPYLSESEQLLTVDKLVPDGHDRSGATALDYDFFLANAVSDNVKAQIHARRQSEVSSGDISK